MSAFTSLISIVSFFCVIHPSLAAIQKQRLEYRAGDTVLEGVLTYDDTQKKPRPGFLIVHDWMGLGEFTEQKAEQLAKQGYVAFAVDIYGKGIRPKDAKEAAEFATRYKTNLPLLRSRIQAAYALLAKRPEVNAAKIIAFGYCFGGTTALELARSGAKLAGTVSFHGGLSTTMPAAPNVITHPLLILHGAADPWVKSEEVEAFKKEMTLAHAKIQIIPYPGAVHAFTNPHAGNDPSKGAAYDASADKQSWADFQAFIRKTL